MGSISLQIPQVNSPNSTEDPKIAADLTAIQTLLNGNLDTTNLSPTAGIVAGQLSAGALGLSFVGASSNMTASPGTMVFAQAGVTVTLPTPTLNTAVMVVPASTVTGTSPVTVSAGSSFIYDGDANTLGGASAILGQGGAGALFVGVSTGWAMVLGVNDTGYLPISLAGTGFSTYSAVGTPSARRTGSWVTLEGGIQNLSGSTIVSGSLVMTLPVGTRPTGHAVGNSVAVSPGFISGVATYTGAAELVFGTAGLAILECDVQNNAFVNFDGFRFRFVN